MYGEEYVALNSRLALMACRARIMHSRKQTELAADNDALRVEDHTLSTSMIDACDDSSYEEKLSFVHHSDIVVQDDAVISIVANKSQSDECGLWPCDEDTRVALRRINDQEHELRDDDLVVIPPISLSTMIDDEDGSKHKPKIIPPSSFVTDVVVTDIPTKPIPDGIGTIEVTPKA